jgi:hypothetical protein
MEGGKRRGGGSKTKKTNPVSQDVTQVVLSILLPNPKPLFQVMQKKFAQTPDLLHVHEKFLNFRFRIFVVFSERLEVFLKRKIIFRINN